jgi:hypothetical protein
MSYTKVAGSDNQTVFAGKRKLFFVKISPDAATGSYTFDKAEAIECIAPPCFAEDLTANCYSVSAAINGTTKNKINFKLWKAGGVAADTDYLDFYLMAVGY